MLKSVQFDIYTMLMIGLVPAMLLAAWGLDSWNSRQLHRTQCEIAVEWLEESAELAPQFTNATTMNRTQFWRAGVEEINSPAHAGMLRSGILQAASYYSANYPELPTDEPGVLHKQNGLFSREIEQGTRMLVDHCPETEALLPEAFPMIFPREESN